MPQLRKDPVTRRWVIIGSKPGEFQPDVEPHPPGKAAFCPFCSGQEDKTPPEIMAYREPGTSANKTGWMLRVVPNKFPALQIEGELDRIGVGMYDKMNGIGAHEVIIESPRHDGSFENFTPDEVERIVWSYRDRLQDLAKDRRFKYLLVFKNSGQAAGASLEHTHSQLIATPVVPKRVVEEISGAQTYYTFRERCVYCDVMRQETTSGHRLAFENKHYVAFCPFASRFPYELTIVPRRHTANFADIEGTEAKALADILKQVIARLLRALNDPPYNYILHTAPVNTQVTDSFHWHLEIIPRLTRVAGFEWGSGFYVNPVTPEDAAKHLREVKV